MPRGIMANSMLNAAAGMLLLVTGFVCSIITARLLGPEANGIIAFSLWFATTGALVAELGTGVLLLRMLPELKAAGHDETRRLGFAAYLVTPTLISTTVLAGLYAAVFIASEEMHWASTAPSVALVTGILFVVQSIGAFAKNYLIGEQRLTTFFRLTVIASALQLVGVLAGALAHGVEGALVGYALAQGVQFLYTLRIVFARRDRCGVPLKVLAGSSAILSVSYMIDSVFLNRIELLFLQQFWSVEAVGFYAVALSVANLALQLPIQLTGSLLPFYAERRAGTENGALPLSVFAGVIRALAYVTLPMALGLAAVSGDLVVLVFGAAFAASGPIVALLALAAPPFVLIQILTQYLFSVDKTRERLLVGVAGSVVIVAACFALVPLLGGPGAAIARLAAFLAMCVLMIRLTGFGPSLGQLYRVLSKILVASAISAGLAWLVLDQIASGIVGLVLAIALGGIAYGASLIVLKAAPPEDVAVLGRLAGRLPGPLRRPLVAAIGRLAPQSTGSEPGQKAPGAGRSAAEPMAIGGIAALYQPEDETVTPRDRAVLFIPAWGYEEICARKFVRLSTEALAAHGVPSLRFDYPATGDSLDAPAEALTLALWEEAALRAAAALKQRSGRERLMLIGQGLGAAIASRIAGRIEGVEAIALLAPLANGRMALRELAIWSKMVDDGLGLPDHLRSTAGVTIAGLVLPPAIADAVKAINLAGETGPLPQSVLIIERPQKIGDRALADALAARGAEVTVEPFDGYDDLVANPTLATMPMAIIDRLAGWAAGNAAPLDRPVTSSGTDRSEPMIGDGHVQTLVRFGARRHLSGVLTVPAGVRSGAPVLLLGTGYDRHSGWGRAGVEFARRLAANGIASLRFDAAGVGDSPPDPDAPRQVLYSDSQAEGVRAALAELGAHEGGRAVLAGRCSGAYQAFRSALSEDGVSAVVAINPFTLEWDPRKDVDALLRFQPRSLDDYGQRLARADTLKRLVRGEIDIPAAARNILIALSRKAGRRFAPLLSRLPGRHGSDLRSSLDRLAARGLAVHLVYSEGDVGLDHIETMFGAKGEGLKRWPNVRLILLPDADHNLTPQGARDAAFAVILEAARTRES